MAEILKLSKWEFKATMISMLRILMGKVESMQEQMGKESREMEILRMNKKKMTKNLKTTVTEMNMSLMGLLVDSHG